MNMTAMSSATESGALDAMHETEGIGRIGSTLATGTGGFDNLDVAYKIIIIVTSIIGAILTLVGILTALKCCKKRGHPNGHGQQSPTEMTTFLPSNAGRRPKLKDVRKRVQAYNKDKASTIPAHPLDPSRTLDIDQFSELELTESLDSNERTQESALLAEGVRNLDKVRTKPLGSLVDVLVTKLRILLSGGAGFGKSTLLLKVTNASTDPTSLVAKFKLVFLVKLKLMQQTCCLLEAIRDQILPDINKADLKKIIDQNERDTAFLLDGLDEIPTDLLNSPVPQGGYGVMDILHNKVLSQSTVLVSTRPHMNRVVIKDYPHYTCVQTRGFTFETAKKYITSYFAGVNATDSGVSLISHIKSQALLRTLAQIPIMVLFMCIVWENESKLPEKLTALYTQFTKALVSRRCNEGEDVEALMKSVVHELGRVALSGLLNAKGERLVFTTEDFVDKEAFKDGYRLGFLQKESIMSGLEMVEVVQFLHKSIQEYLAGCCLARLHDTDKGKFDEELKKVDPENVLAVENLLRFACGIASGSEATGLILQHVQKQKLKVIVDTSEKREQNLARHLLFESGSSEMVEKLDRPTVADCNSQEDLLALQYYLHCLPQTLEKLTVRCKSHEEFVLLRDLYQELAAGTLPKQNNLRPTCRSHGDLNLLSVILRYIGPRLGFCWMTYAMSEQVNKALQTLEELLEGMDERHRGLSLTLEINETSHFDDCVLGSLSHVCSQIDSVVLHKRTHLDVIRLGKVLGTSVRVYDTYLHGHLGDVIPLVSQSLHFLTLQSCGLDDDDIPDLIRMLPARHGLWVLDIDGNAFSARGVETLTAHLNNLPDLGKPVYGL